MTGGEQVRRFSWADAIAAAAGLMTATPPPGKSSYQQRVRRSNLTLNYLLTRTNCFSFAAQC
ncbi:MAG: hypothetical protein AVDCRST_MAG28-3480 [uncultured Rubrobacteraceae bacterium]|uniref:Uncharacterized protein n=1 Tax=uncultured Rubrobacteraceae bacterium TaxID=349277 RepID=A0A6J4R5T4_9ACTN|nr:MAG: hypothetical protein AVDCRST_MAG28-3480 [uncultured Rubrobacteraceae bacterium]